MHGNHVLIINTTKKIFQERVENLEVIKAAMKMNGFTEVSKNENDLLDFSKKSKPKVVELEVPKKTKKVPTVRKN